MGKNMFSKVWCYRNNCASAERQCVGSSLYSLRPHQHTSPESCSLSCMGISGAVEDGCSSAKGNREQLCYSHHSSVCKYTHTHTHTNCLSIVGIFHSGERGSREVPKLNRIWLWKCMSVKESQLAGYGVFCSSEICETLPCFFSQESRLFTVECILHTKWGCALVTLRIISSYRI